MRSLRHASGFVNGTRDRDGHSGLRDLASAEAIPAGVYTNRTELHSWGGSVGLLLTADAPHRDVTGSARGKLVFNRYGNVLVLSEMWRYGSSYGHRLPESRMEREMAGRAAPAAMVEIASLAGR